MATIQEALAIGLGHHRAGRFPQAEQVYRQVLQVSPDQTDALHLLGLIAYQQGQIETAIEHFRRALAVDDRQAAFHNSLGMAHIARDRIAPAIACYVRALELQPDYADAHHNLGAAYHVQGRLDEAAACFQRAIECHPQGATAYNSLGMVRHDQGNSEAAIACYRQALALRPDFPEAHYSLGRAQRERGQLEEAIACYQRALAARPDYPEALNNLGTVWQEMGHPDEAIGCYQQAIRLKPAYARAHYNLGNVWSELGNLDQAAACYQRAIELRPDYADAHANLGNLWRGQEKLPEAAACYRRAQELSAAQSPTGQRYLDLHPLRIAALCPSVFESGAAIDAYRQQLLDEVTRIGCQGGRVNLAELATSSAEPPFNLLYHGRDNRPIREAWAKVFRDMIPQGPRPTPGPRPRIGLVVTGRHEAIFLRWWQPVLQRMRVTQFQIVIVCSRGGAARIGAALRGDSIELLVMPPRFDQMLETIGSARFDVLYHWEVGSDAINYFLPFFRLAPVQVNSWGLQVTSGIGPMDYYLSSDLLEPDDGAEHYTEKLIRAKTLLAYHEKPALPPVLQPREAFGLRVGQHLYVCAQNLRKIHPDFDAVLAQVLQQDAAGRIVLVNDRQAHVAERLRQRFARTIPEVTERIVFLPRLSYDDYWSLVSAADVLLDPLYYNSGTTGYDGLLLGKPIVTLPWRFQIGRSVLACYRKMGIAGCVARDAGDYVRLAVALGTDADYREAVGREIAAASPELLEDMAAVREYEDVFGRLVEESRCR